MKYKRIKLLGFMLTLALVIGLMPGMSLTAYADDPYADIKNTTTAVTFDNKNWYLIDYDESTVTLLLKECVAASQYDSNGSSYTYNGSTVESTVNNWYTQNITANAQTAVVDNKMFLLTKDQANAMTVDTRKCSQYSGTDKNAWWLCSPGYTNSRAAYVFGSDGEVDGDGNSVDDTLGVRPALKLNLESVIFSSETNTFTAAESSTYTITIPDTLTVQNIGWNELEGGITASGDLESGKKLVITASSDNNFNFVKSGDNTAQIPYVFTSRDAGNGKSYSDVQNSSVTSWTFDKLTEAGTSHDVGIVIDDYSSKPAGTYKETVTFTAKVETAQILVTSLELTDNSMFFYGKAWPGVGGGFTLNIRVLPENATNKRLNWSIDGDECISLSVGDDTLTCHVTGEEPGEATITVSTTDGSNLSQTFSVEVEEPEFE